jgi:2-amino-4-hydroxy-6-hydroxymethyldihydropteridine diphosphokinase
MVISYIAVGSNLGDRRYYIQSAVKKLRQLPGTKVKKVSGLVETQPEGDPRWQGMYLNGVIELETELFPYRLLAELQQIESELGRIRIWLNGPRTIDLDILSYGDVVMREAALCIPHPRMFTRTFVLKPLEEIAPGKGTQLKKLVRIKSRLVTSSKKTVKKPVVSWKAHKTSKVLRK